MSIVIVSYTVSEVFNFHFDCAITADAVLASQEQQDDGNSNNM